MFKKLLFTTVLLLSSVAAFAANNINPTLFWSDLTSAQAGAAGVGENDKGAYVTVGGINFGDTRGTSYVTVGNQQVYSYYPVWTDTKITFQLGDNAVTGDIVVHTSTGASNGLPFTVRSTGHIYFCSPTSPTDPGTGTFAEPFRSPRTYYLNCEPGDICYFRAGTYDGKYGRQARTYNITFDQDCSSGTETNPIAWVGYPGEVAYWEAADADPDTLSENIHFDADPAVGGIEWHTIAGMKWYAKGGDSRDPIRLYTPNLRFINNDVVGREDRVWGQIAISGQNLNCKVYGNTIHGCRGDKLDHVVYFQAGATNVDFGWNTIYDINFDQGPIIQFNSDDGHLNTSIIYGDVDVHDNYIDCRSYDEPGHSGGIARVMSVADAYQNPVSTSTIDFYNNLVLFPSNPSGDNSLYIYSCNVNIYNNTFFRCTGYGYSTINITDCTDTNVTNYQDWHPQVVNIKNNIFYTTESDHTFFTFDTTKSTLTVDSNVYWGSSLGIPTQDANAVLKDPQFVSSSATAWDLHLGALSQILNEGADTTDVCPTDYDGTTRDPGVVDPGAYEFIPVDANSSDARFLISGYAKDNTATAIPGVYMGLTGDGTAHVYTTATGSYVFNGLSSGTYTVTPTLSGYTFEPSSRTVTITSLSQTNFNFLGTGSGVTPTPIQPGEMRVKVYGVQVTSMYLGDSAQVEFYGYITGNYKFVVFNDKGIIIYSADLANTRQSYFDWTPSAVGTYFPCVKGPSDMMPFSKITVENAP